MASVPSVAMWIVNVFTFSLLYWQIDRGGPDARANHSSPRPDWLFPQVGVSMVEVFRRLGVEVAFPEAQTCCGQPAYNSGDRGDAKVIASIPGPQPGTSTLPDGTKVATLPDGTKVNIDLVPPQDPTPASEPPVGDRFYGTIATKLDVTPSGAAVYKESRMRRTIAWVCHGRPA